MKYGHKEAQCCTKYGKPSGRDEQNNQAVEVSDNQEEEVALAVWCEDEELDWSNEPQENQEETNDDAQADGQARRNNPDNMEEICEGGGVARMI